MGLRDMLRAIREYPRICNNLKEAQYKLREVRQALNHSEQERERLDVSLRERTYRLNFAGCRAEAALSALNAFCPKLSSVEEMKQFYAAVSPSLNPSSFTLCHVAERMTGIDLYGYFPYEDSQEMFEKLDGRQCLHYLIAARFHAVDWEAVPGTIYEAAVLREVNTATPEYQLFEKHLYEKVLERMGFQDILAEDHQKEKMETTRAVITAPHKSNRGGAAR